MGSQFDCQTARPTLAPDNDTPENDLRMVSGAVIANYIFFDIEKPSTGDGSFRIRALPRHEIWLESTQERLGELAGELKISSVATQEGAGRLSREGAGYKLELYTTSEKDGALDQLSASERCTVSVIFDVEYQQSYDSPGGYSDAHGIHYWDDVRYPIVELSRFKIQSDQ